MVKYPEGYNNSTIVFHKMKQTEQENIIYTVDFPSMRTIHLRQTVYLFFFGKCFLPL